MPTERPLDIMPGELQVRAGWLSGFHALIQRYEGDPCGLLRRFGIDPLHLADADQFIDSVAVLRLLESCRSIFSEPLFGLRLAEMQEPDVLGSVVALARAAATVGDGIVALVEYLPVTLSRHGEVVLIRRGPVAELRWLSSHGAAICEQADYQLLMLLVKFMRMLTTPGFTPKSISLRTAPSPRTRTELAKTLACTVEFDCPDNTLKFPAELLVQPVPSANRLIYRLIKEHLRTIKLVADADIKTRVQSYIRGALPSGNCTIARCARKLGITVRALQVQLDKAGVSFSDLLENERIEVAKGELHRGLSSVQEIGDMLGYSEQASFGRAFKRWTGLSPRAFRENQRRQTSMAQFCAQPANGAKT